jgi:hypothetical protein
MKQTDRDRISTRQLNRLRRRILRVYGNARREMQEQLTEFLAKYKALDERKRAQLDVGEITEEDYRIWLQNQVFQSDLMHAKLDGITQTCTTAQQTAYKLARDEQYNIFSFGANWAFYELEQAAGVNGGCCCTQNFRGWMPRYCTPRSRQIMQALPAGLEPATCGFGDRRSTT